MPGCRAPEGERAVCPVGGTEATRAATRTRSLQHRVGATPAPIQPRTQQQLVSCITQPRRTFRRRRHAASVAISRAQPSRLFLGPMWCRQVVPASRLPSPATKRDSSAYVVMWCPWCQAPDGSRSSAVEPDQAATVTPRPAGHRPTGSVTTLERCSSPAGSDQPRTTPARTGSEQHHAERA
jgi:hypothetical protein